MIGIYIICFIVFPISICFPCHISKLADECLNKQDSDTIKGIATSFVILAHLTIYLKNTGGGHFKALDIFNVMGGMGVLLFFFVSGYGLYKGYSCKKIGVQFWKKRIINVYIPCIIIQFVFYICETVITQKFDIGVLTINSLFGAWFIDVILIQYFIFFITWIIAGGSHKKWIVSSFLLSVVVAFIFWIRVFNPRWYNGLMLFPFGMLIAYLEKKIIPPIQKKWLIFFIVTIILSGISGIVFTLFKGTTGWINVVKTFSGMCLSILTCIIFMKVKFNSKIMQYIGKRSLYFYLVHLNLLLLLGMFKNLQEISVCYLVLILTFLISSGLYWIHSKIISIGWS